MLFKIFVYSEANHQPKLLERMANLYSHSFDEIENRKTSQFTYIHIQCFVCCTAHPDGISDRYISPAPTSVLINARFTCLSKNEFSVLDCWAMGTYYIHRSWEIILTWDKNHFGSYGYADSRTGFPT